MKVDKKTVNGQPVGLSDYYISNGHWLVRRSSVDNASMFASDATVKAFLGNETWCRNLTTEAANTIVNYAKNNGAVVEFTRTSNVINVRGKLRRARVFLHQYEDGSKLERFIPELYASQFCIDTLYGSVKAATPVYCKQTTDVDPYLVIMPLLQVRY